MPVISLTLSVVAPIDRVFDLSRSVDLHVHSTSTTREVAVAGVTTGLLSLGDEVTWEGTHLGVRQRLSSRITEFKRPTHFRDSLVKGAFKSFHHDHDFATDRHGTMVTDRFEFQTPLGLLGQLANAAGLTRYMKRFLRMRLEVMKSVAESDEWMRYLHSQIFVYLQDEGVDVWRPVYAHQETPGLYRIVSPDPDPENEVWQFKSGELVRCEERVMERGRRELVAIEKIDEAV